MVDMRCRPTLDRTVSQLSLFDGVMFSRLEQHLINQLQDTWFMSVVIALLERHIRLCRLILWQTSWIHFRPDRLMSLLDWICSESIFDPIRFWLNMLSEHIQSKSHPAYASLVCSHSRCRLVCYSFQYSVTDNRTKQIKVLHTREIRNL